MCFLKMVAWVSMGHLRQEARPVKGQGAAILQFHDGACPEEAGNDYIIAQPLQLQPPTAESTMSHILSC